MVYYNPHITGYDFIPNKYPNNQGPFFHCSDALRKVCKTFEKKLLGIFVPFREPVGKVKLFFWEVDLELGAWLTGQSFFLGEACVICVDGKFIQLTDRKCKKNKKNTMWRWKVDLDQTISWLVEPANWKIWVKLEHFPQVGGKYFSKNQKPPPRRLPSSTGIFSRFSSTLSTAFAAPHSLPRSVPVQHHDTIVSASHWTDLCRFRMSDSDHSFYDNII